MAALVGFVLAVPLMLIIAILVKFTSRGPMLFKQTRIGVDRRNGRIVPSNARRQWDFGGQTFTIHKFRTMRVTTGNRDA